MQAIINPTKTCFSSMSGGFSRRCISFVVTSVNAHIHLPLYWRSFSCTKLLNILSVNKDWFHWTTLMDRNSALVEDTSWKIKRTVFSLRRSFPHSLFLIFQKLIFLHVEWKSWVWWKNIMLNKKNNMKNKKFYPSTTWKRILWRLTKVSTINLNLLGFKWSFDALQLYFSNRDHLHPNTKQSKVDLVYQD